jgi:hypothetical protein
MARDALPDGTFSRLRREIRDETGQGVMRLAFSLVVEEGTLDDWASGWWLSFIHQVERVRRVADALNGDVPIPQMLRPVPMADSLSQDRFDVFFHNCLVGAYLSSNLGVLFPCLQQKKNLGFWI